MADELELEEVLALIEQALREGYEKGWSEGWKDARWHLLQETTEDLRRVKRRWWNRR